MTTTSQETLEQLLRTLRRYSDGPLGLRLARVLHDLADQTTTGLVAYDQGSEERQVEAILAVVVSGLSDLVLSLRMEIGEQRLDARSWLEDVDPTDFEGESW